MESKFCRWPTCSLAWSGLWDTRECLLDSEDGKKTMSHERKFGREDLHEPLNDCGMEGKGTSHQKNSI